MEDKAEDKFDARALAARARGRVQNVGFRVFVQEVAHRFGLRGYTRNSSDGSVEVVACGDHARLEQFLGFLRRGPMAARVDTVDYQWLEQEPEGLSGRFEVRA